MSFLGRAKEWINRGIAPLNMRLDSRTAERAEASRLARRAAAGHFDRPIFPLLRQFRDCDPTAILDEVHKHEERFAKFDAVPAGQGFRLDNSYFQSPDAEVLYAMVRLYRPRQIVEVGSGHSTLLMRQAISDGGLATRLTSIDPSPRREVADHADRWIRSCLEDVDDATAWRGLAANDILFVDSSHEVKAGNDVVRLFLTILPALPPGVLVHIHDIFLPYEYPRQWIVENRWTWSEQYLLQALLQDNEQYEVLWCGHYLEKTYPGLLTHFRHWKGSGAGSVWMRKRGDVERSSRDG